MYHSLLNENIIEQSMQKKNTKTAQDRGSDFENCLWKEEKNDESCNTKK